VKAASGRIVIMPGCGMTSSNASQIAKSTGAREFHAGLSSTVRDDQPREFETEVRQLVETLAMTG